VWRAEYQQFCIGKRVWRVEQRKLTRILFCVCGCLALVSVAIAPQFSLSNMSPPFSTSQVEIAPVEVLPVGSVPSVPYEGGRSDVRSDAGMANPYLSEPSIETLQSEILEDLQRELHLDEAFTLFDKYEAEIRTVLPDFSFEGFFQDLLRGEGGLSFGGILQGILRFCLQTFVVNGPLIAKLVVLAVFCAILNQLQLAFGGQVSQVARLLNVFVLIGLAVASFRVALDAAVEAIDNMVSFMQAIMPIMFTVLLSMGNLTSSALFKPVILGSLTVLATILKNVVLPLFFLAVGLKLFNSVSGQFRLERLANLLEMGGDGGESGNWACYDSFFGGVECSGVDGWDGGRGGYAYSEVFCGFGSGCGEVFQGCF